MKIVDFHKNKGFIVFSVMIFKMEATVGTMRQYEKTTKKKRMQHVVERQVGSLDLHGRYWQYIKESRQN